MRLLVLMLNILVGSSLLAQSTEILAASANTKANKISHQRGHAQRLREKNKKPRMIPAKQKRLSNPGDVWERIRSGMQIPRPSPAQTLPEQKMITNNSLSVPPAITNTGFQTDAIIPSDASISRVQPHSAKTRSERFLALRKKLKLPITASAPMDNYTPYGRQRLNAAVSSRIRKNIAIQNRLIALQNNKSHSTSEEQTRLRTRIMFHPKLSGMDLDIGTEPLSPSALVLEKTVKANGLNKPVSSSRSSELTEKGMTSETVNTAKESAKYDRVNKHIIWYTQHRGYLHQVAERARPYLYHIVDGLGKHKLPYELALLPIVESAYQPTALSPKSAAGLWQFIPSTGHDFDLQQSEHYDARLDVAASTQAAIRYLSFLKQHFNGDWLLALAAYNCGLGLVDDAIKRNVAEGLDKDFWSLRLPEETQEYVPRFLALSSIFANPAAHGLKLAPVRNEPYFIKVKIEREHDIEYLAEKDFKEVAQLANLSYEQFNRLNPGYLNPKLAAQGPFTFLMPADNANQLRQRLDSIAHFMNESPTITASHPPLKRRSLYPLDEQNTALSLLSDIKLPKGAAPVTGHNPFLSLNLDTNQTTPRIVNQSVITPFTSNPDPKRIKKNI